MKPDYSRAAQAGMPAMFLILAVSPHIEESPPSTLLWAAPSILVAALLIAWAAESAQYFIAQGFALAILAWLQTLPEFAVEAVLAWKQQTPLLLANLTGALRLLTGIGWPMIYCTAAFVHRRNERKPLNRITLEEDQSVNVIALLPPLLYMIFVWWKSSLDVIDAGVLIVLYGAYLFVLSKMPAKGHEGVDDLEAIPKAIVKARPALRILTISALFIVGGGLIYASAEPFLGSLMAVSTMLGVPQFLFIQWVAPFVSEFPEGASTFYWARKPGQAPTALMNMVSSNINQWTLLAAMLPIIYSISRGTLSAIPFDSQQELELLMTIGQALVGFLFLINMELKWWEAATLFGLFMVQFVCSSIPVLADPVRVIATIAYFVWAGIELVMLIARRQTPLAWTHFRQVLRQHVA